MYSLVNCFFFFKQKTAYEMRISDWSSDVCSSDLQPEFLAGEGRGKARRLLQQHAERPRRQRRLQLAQHQWRGRLSDPAARRAPLRCAGQFLLQMTPPGTRKGWMALDGLPRPSLSRRRNRIRFESTRR